MGWPNLGVNVPLLSALVLSAKHAQGGSVEVMMVAIVMASAFNPSSLACQR
jgi:hypothetical protein